MIVMSSFGIESPIIRDKLMDLISPIDKSVLLIPFAGYNVPFTIQKETELLKSFGFSSDKIRILSTDKPPTGTVDFIYTPGGDTFKLLYTLKKNNLLGYIKNIVQRYNSTYIGVSAGAYICCQNIQYVLLLEDNNYDFDNFEALGFIRDENIICHSDQISYATISQCKHFTPNKNYLFIDNTAIKIK